MPPAPGATEVLAALDDVVESLEQACAEGELAAEQARDIRRRSALGLPLCDVLVDHDQVPVVRQVASVLQKLGTASSRLRRTQARALHAEGLTTDRIAVLFGVTRQRISVLLRNPHGGE